MPFDAKPPRALAPGSRIAVVGSGVSGLTAAWLLSKAYEVVVYEADARLGGHANTVDVPTAGGATPVDAGFIVYNDANYPNLTALFAELGVATEESCMSFAASMRGGSMEYCGRTLSSVFASRRNLLSPRFYGMLVDIVRFHKAARAAVASGSGAEIALRDFVKREGLGRAFARDFLEPMAAAIWSTPSADILDFPADAFFRFFANHGLLQVLDMPVWRTVSGGSRRYVEKIAAPFAGAARLSTPVARIDRGPDGACVVDAKGGRDRFDAVVLATHADMALALLDEPSAQEEDVLGAFRYQTNEAVMHFDANLMPRRRRAWASWNYIGADRPDGGASVSYWMNRLQNLTCAEDVFVTLNPVREVREDAVVARFVYDHPMYDLDADAAQDRLWSLQGGGGVWYCGAHFGAGFHEDGAQAGLAVAEALGAVRRPWTVANESGRIRLPEPALAA
ncbi:MAG: FAD-dependent oxidoreductase [Pseudomonadota bacterium]